MRIRNYLKLIFESIHIAQGNTYIRLERNKERKESFSRQCINQKNFNHASTCSACVEVLLRPLKSLARPPVTLKMTVFNDNDVCWRCLRVLSICLCVSVYLFILFNFVVRASFEKPERKKKHTHTKLLQRKKKVNLFPVWLTNRRKKKK